MSYLSRNEFIAIKNTVNIIPVSSEMIGDVSQYSFFCGNATEYSSLAKRKGYGFFILDTVNVLAFALNDLGIACRFLTVDADIEYSRDTPQFYAKNGFFPNKSRKPRATDRTVSMHRDIMKI